MWMGLLQRWFQGVHPEVFAGRGSTDILQITLVKTAERWRAEAPGGLVRFESMTGDNARQLMKISKV